MRVFVLAFLCLTPCIWAQSKAEPSAQTLVFTNVNVVDTRDGRILYDMTVVVRSGQIQGVARFGLIAENHNVRVINAAGKYMIPGLWDMDVHTAGTSGSAWDEKIIYPLYELFCSPVARKRISPASVIHCGSRDYSIYVVSIE